VRHRVSDSEAGKTGYVVIVGHPGAVVSIATATNTPGQPALISAWAGP
jgi:hypothetical protein